jgi:hypothetical protein
MQNGRKRAVWGALEAKVEASCGQNVDELWIAGQHSPSAYHEGFGGLGHALGF